jgi:general secretion pathway protein K
MRQTAPQQQRGVALITAILLVAIATTLAAKIAWDNQLNMRRTESTLNREQGRQFAMGAEAVAVDQLINYRVDNAYDFFGLGDFTNLYSFGPIVLPLELDGEVVGQMTGEIFDAQNKLNINNLVRASDGKPNLDVKSQFELLFNQPQFRDTGVDSRLVDTLIDWIDNDTVPSGSGGAEDGTYTSLAPPYRPANNYLQDISELRSVFGVSPDVYEALLPFVTAIPPGWCGTAGTGVMLTNVNFIENAIVLAALLDMPTSDADKKLTERPEDGWADMDLFKTNLLSNEANRAVSFATVESNCSILNVNVIIGSSTLTMYSLLDRASNGSIYTRVRAFGLD